MNLGTTELQNALESVTCYRKRIKKEGRIIRVTKTEETYYRNFQADVIEQQYYGGTAG
jgi:hypothetical protein